MILEKARELGIALSESAEFTRMNAAREAMEANEAVMNMLEEYQKKQENIVNQLSSGDMDRAEVVALSSDVEALQAQLLENPLFAEAMEAQDAFQHMMKLVNQEIARCIGVETEEDHACSGSCAGCSGCQH